MATAGIFNLLTNDGKQDNILLATEHLKKRLAEVNFANQARNGGALDDPLNMPTLGDIEKTHILFTNAHFKPFAALGFEYAKVSTSSGAPSLGSTVEFSIPQFGDFFYDICCHVILTQPTLSTTDSTILSSAPAMRWCHFPGERLLKSVRQDVNGNPLDQYSSHATNFHREFSVLDNKKEAWNRCVGQEEAESGYISQPNWAASGQSAPTSRVASRVFVGNQTPSSQKSTALEMFVPLLFWYNQDVRLAVPSVSIPYGQRFIRIELAAQDELVDVFPRGAATFASPNGSVATSSITKIELYVNNIFINPEIHKIYIKRVGFTLIRVHREHTANLNTSSAEVLLNSLKWPVEYMFVGLKVKSYFNSSTAADKKEHMDKWHLFSSVSSQTYKTDGQNVLYERWLAYVAASGAEGTVGITAATGALVTGNSGVATVAIAAGDTVRIGGGIYFVTTGIAAGAAVTGAVVSPLPAANVSSATGARIITFQGLQVATQRLARTIDTMSIKAHGINLYDSFPTGFFSDYMAYRFGSGYVNSPEHTGAMFVNFCLYPGAYQPSGHINVSRAREFYLSYSSSVISSGTEGVLVVVAMCINFLLISDGSAVLRYST